LADPQPVGIGPDLDQASGDLVARDQADRTGRLGEVQIRPTDPAALDLDDHVAASWRRIRELDHLERLTCNSDCAHLIPQSIFR
jgi:hypothetical protein